nr:RNA-directed DNA polymerase, eukaryota, reverse transcriptase zinc-binding domain protein [Tanacetum cinerariifolium]
MLAGAIYGEICGGLRDNSPRWFFVFSCRELSGGSSGAQVVVAGKVEVGDVQCICFKIVLFGVWVNGKISPCVTQGLTRNWYVFPSAYEEFEVRCGDQAYAVNLSSRTCSCRLWQLSSVPYIYVVASNQTCKQIKCSNCQGGCHNKASCENPSVSKPITIVKKVPGRRREPNVQYASAKSRGRGSRGGGRGPMGAESGGRGPMGAESGGRGPIGAESGGRGPMGAESGGRCGMGSSIGAMGTNNGGRGRRGGGRASMGGARGRRGGGRRERRGGGRGSTSGLNLMDEDDIRQSMEDEYMQGLLDEQEDLRHKQEKEHQDKLDKEALHQTREEEFMFERMDLEREREEQQWEAMSDLLNDYRFPDQEESVDVEIVQPAPSVPASDNAAKKKGKRTRSELDVPLKIYHKIEEGKENITVKETMLNQNNKGDGSKVSVWYDNWCALSHLSGFISYRDIYGDGLYPSTKVKDIIDNGSWSWPDEWNSKPQPDSHDHLFFECMFSLQVWEHLKPFTSMSDIPSDLNSIVDFLIPLAKMWSARSVITKLVFVVSCYFIWQERNDRLFAKKKRSQDQVIDIIKSIIRLKLLTCRFKKTYCEALLVRGSEVIARVECPPVAVLIFPSPRWLRVVPIKVNVHAWWVFLDKSPTRANISLRGMDIPSIALWKFSTMARSLIR